MFKRLARLDIELTVGIVEVAVALEHLEPSLVAVLGPLEPSVVLEPFGLVHHALVALALVALALAALALVEPFEDILVILDFVIRMEEVLRWPYLNETF